MANLGWFYYNQGSYDQAIESYQKSIAIARKISDAKMQICVLGGLVLNFEKLGIYEQAIEYYQQSLALVQETGDRKKEGRNLANLGWIYYNQGINEQALQYRKKSLAIAREIGDREQEGETLANLGQIYYRQGSYEQAIEYYQQSIDIIRAIGDPSEEAIYQSDLGLALLQVGNLAAAERTLFASIEVMEALRVGLSDTHHVSIFETQERPYLTLQQVLVALNQPNKTLEIAEQRCFAAKQIYQMPARHSSYLYPNQFVQIVHTASQKLYGWCEVKDLKAFLTLTGSDVNDFHLKPLDAQGNPVPIQNLLQVQPYRFLVFESNRTLKIDLNLAFQLTITVLTISLLLIHSRGNVSRAFVRVISSEHYLNQKHNHPIDFGGDGQPSSDQINGGATYV